MRSLSLSLYVYTYIYIWFGFLLNEALILVSSEASTIKPEF